MKPSAISELLRRSPAEILAVIAPDDPLLAGALYAAPPDEHVTGAPARMISGGSLCSQARTPFVLDGVTYPTLQRFYEALKAPAGPLRARFVAGATRRELGLGRGHVGATFDYGGATIAVGAPAHLQLIARAVSAKVAAHPEVKRELRATGRARLYMGADQPLGKSMPFALMVERLRLGPPSGA